MPEMLHERKQNGILAFPRLEAVELCHVISFTGGDNPQLQNDLLQILRIRSQDPAVPRISVLRIDRSLVKNLQFKEELERCVPSLVLI